MQPQRLADLSARLPADDDRFDLGQIAFEIVRVLHVEQLADDRAQDRVAEKFETLIGRQPVLSTGGMRQGRDEQRFVAKFVTNAAFATLQLRELGLGHRRADSRRHGRETATLVKLAKIWSKASPRLAFCQSGLRL